MRIAFTYPPIQKYGKFPLLSQNRQFRYSSSYNVRIFPLVMATAATMIKNEGHEVLWLDGINERLSIEQFMFRLKVFNPELIVMETKAPILKDHWHFLNGLKNKLKDTKTVFVGDHVTAFPEESLQNSPVDFIITGGDYDLILKDFVSHLAHDTKMPAGIYFRYEKEISNSGENKQSMDLDTIPFIDRDLTCWNIYGEAYLYHSCAYILTGRGCGGTGRRSGRCKFCIWQNILWKGTCRLRSPQNVVEEISILVNKYKVKEIFDDNESGAIWNKEWLREFHSEMNKKDLINKVAISSNARADSLDKETCQLLKQTGFRLLKVGVESANNETLKRLNKDETIEDIIAGIICAKDHGLKVLMTTMVGYPWETEADAAHTYEVTKELLLYRSHLGDSLQSSVVISYPGTPLYYEAIREGWFAIDPANYADYDMSRPLFSISFDPMLWCDRMWSLHKHPLYLWRTLWQIRSIDDIEMLWRSVKSLLGHTKDF